MASFSDYLEQGYLPGQVYRAGLSRYRFEPQAVTEYIADKKFKFKPDKDEGSYFQQFMALQNNPELLANQAFSSSPGFFNAMSTFGGSRYN